MSYTYILENFKLKKYLNPHLDEWVEIYETLKEVIYCIWYPGNNSYAPSTIIKHEKLLD